MTAKFSVEGSVDRATERFLSGSGGQRGWKRWLWYLWCQPGHVVSFVIVGLVGAVTAALIPVAFDGLSGSAADLDEFRRNAFALVGLLAVGLVLSVVRMVVEFRLVLITRSVAYRSLFRIGMTWPLTVTGGVAPTQGTVTTQPMQVSQFVYVVDLIVTVVGALIISVAVVASFGVPGFLAMLGLVGFSFCGIRLINAIGGQYERWLATERQRVSAIGEYARNAEPVRRSGLQEAAGGWVHRRRLVQRPVLERRARLQLLNTFCNGLAVYAVVALAAVASVALGNGLDGLLPVLVAATIFYGYLQEILSNYRVVRFTLPMLREEDQRLEQFGGELIESKMRPGVASFEVRSDADRQHFRSLAASDVSLGNALFVPSNPALQEETLQHWHCHVNEGERAVFDTWCQRLLLPTDLDLTGEPERLNSLSNGERHRLAIALALTARPSRLFLEETLSPIDASTRSIVLAELEAETELSVLISTVDDQGERPQLDPSKSSDEDAQIVDLTDGENHTDQAGEATRAAGSETAPPAISEKVAWPNPMPQKGDSWRSMRRLFGADGAAVAVAALVASAAIEIVFPLAIGQLASQLSPIRSLVVVFIPVVVLAVSLAALARLEFHQPITSVDLLHDRLSMRLEQVARRSSADELLGRMGSDLASVQMEVPGIYLRFAHAVVQLAALAIAVTLGSWLLGLAVVALIFPSFLLYRRGDQRLQTAADQAARSRNDYHGRAGALVDDRLVSSNGALASSAQAVVARAERAYLANSWDNARVLVGRRIEMSLLSLSIVVCGLVAILSGWSTGLLKDSLVLYFVYSLSSRLPTLIAAAQGMRLATATHLRAEVPLAQRLGQRQPTFTSPVIEELLERIRAEVDDSTKHVIRVAGPTGSGKSAALRCLQDERPASEVAIFGADVPLLFPEASDYVGENGGSTSIEERAAGGALVEDNGVASLGISDRQRVIARLAATAPHRIVVLDESLNALDQTDARSVLADLGSSFREQGRKLIVVSHGTRDLDLVDVTVDVAGRASNKRDQVMMGHQQKTEDPGYISP